MFYCIYNFGCLFQTWRVPQESDEQVEVVKWLIEQDMVEILNEVVGGVIILVSEHKKHSVKNTFERHDSFPRDSVTVLSHDVGKDIETEQTCTILQTRSGTSKAFSFDKFFQCYHGLKEHHQFLDELVKAHPDKAETVSIGATFLKKDMKLIRISNNVGSAADKPMIFIDGGIHGREWVSITTVQWIAATLLGEVDSSLSGSIKDLMEKYQFVVLPVANPDGFSYTREFGIGKRFWRKTRRPLSTFCTGVDPNRNWDVQFATKGVSSKACDETYPGENPFSENNTKAMKAFLVKNLSKVKLYISYHAWSQALLRPYFYKIDRPDNARILEAAGDVYVKAAYGTHGIMYTSVQGYNFYPVSGTSSSWMYKQGVVNSYTVEVRDKGDKGFLLPTDQIVPTGEENVRGLIALIRQLKY